MLRKWVVYLWLVGIVSAGGYQYEPPPLYNAAAQSSVSLSNPEPSLDVSRLQQYYKIPLEAKVLQGVYSNQKHQSQFQGAAYVKNPSATVSINPAVVKTLPSGGNKVAVEAQQQVAPPAATYVAVPVALQPVQYHAQVNHPAVQYVTIPVGNSHAVYSADQYASKAVYKRVAAHNPHIQYVQNVAQPPAVHYISAPVDHGVHSELVNIVSRVPQKKVTIESHQSVTAHPPSAAYVTPPPVVTHAVNRHAVQLVSASVRHTVQPPAPHVQYSPPPKVNKPITVFYSAEEPRKPIPIPVYYSAEEPQEQQYLTIPNNAQALVIVKQVPAAVAQPIPVPVLYPQSEAHSRYNHKVATATQVRPGNAGYARAAVYSPASAVTSVNFNGLGVSYNW